MVDDVAKLSEIEKASPEVQLAVDLIYLLESNHISLEIALAAIKIVEKDLQQQLHKKRHK